MTDSKAGTVVISALTGAVASIAAAFLTGYFPYASKDEELKMHLVEVALGILRAKPEEGIANARGWAIAVIQRYSGVDFPLEDRNQLLLKPIKTGAYSSDFNPDFVGARGGLITESMVQGLFASVADLQKKVRELGQKAPAPPSPSQSSTDSPKP